MTEENIESELEELTSDLASQRDFERPANKIKSFSDKFSNRTRGIVKAVGILLVTSTLAWFTFLEDVVNKTPMEKAADFFKENNFREAIVWYDSSLALDSNNIEALMGKGISLREYEDMELAEKQFDIILEMDSTQNDAWYNKGKIQLSNKNYRKAIEFYENSNTINYDISYGMAIAHHNLQEYEEALKWYNNTIQIAPKYIRSYYGKAGVLRDLGFYTVALKTINIALAADKRSFDYNYVHGCILYDMKEYYDARNAFRVSTEVKPNNKSAWVALGNSQQMLGYVYYKAALESYEKALSIDPSYELAKKQREKIIRALK